VTLEAREVRWEPGGLPIVAGVTLSVVRGGVLGLVGPNGSGKSSLLRLLAGLRRGTGGAVLLDGRALSEVPRREVARRIALVAQHADTDTDLTVREVVRLGRTPHRGPWDGWTEADEAAVEGALERTGMAGRAGQAWATLSGGERQRAQIARALAQGPSELLLDEPTNHLDIRHQIDLLRLLGRLGTSTVIALHDLDHAAAFCDRIAVMEEGRLVAQGAPTEVMTPQMIRQVFGVEAVIHRRDAGGRPRVEFLV
jgi:iron complex transport system ATP-binding protein